MPVLTGSRPTGAARRSETSRSAWSTWPSTCGMGVAVMSSTWTEPPLADSASRSATPKRCCSSTTASRRSAKPMRSWTSAWVPTNTQPPAAAHEGRGVRGARPGDSAVAALGRADAAGQEHHIVAERLQQARRGSPRAGGPAGRWVPGAPTGRRHPPRTSWPAPPPRSCPSRRRPGRAASSVDRRRGRPGCAPRRPAGRPSGRRVSWPVRPVPGRDLDADGPLHRGDRLRQATVGDSDRRRLVALPQSAGARPCRPGAPAARRRRDARARGRAAAWSGGKWMVSTAVPMGIRSPRTAGPGSRDTGPSVSMAARMARRRVRARMPSVSRYTGSRPVARRARRRRPPARSQGSGGRLSRDRRCRPCPQRGSRCRAARYAAR